MHGPCPDIVIISYVQFPSTAHAGLPADRAPSAACRDRPRFAAVDTHLLSRLHVRSSCSWVSSDCHHVAVLPVGASLSPVAVALPPPFRAANSAPTQLPSHAMPSPGPALAAPFGLSAAVRHPLHHQLHNLAFSPSPSCATGPPCDPLQHTSVVGGWSSSV